MAKHEDPVFKPSEMAKKLKNLQKLYNKVAKKPKPAPPKEEKKPEEAEDFADGDAESAKNNTKDAPEKDSEASQEKGDS